MFGRPPSYFLSLKIKRSSGFSLIEILLTLAIFIAILTASIPLAGSWNQTLKKTNAHGLVKTAMNVTRANAQKNRFSNTSLDSSSSLCLNESTIFVRESTAAAPASCASDGDIIWQAQWLTQTDLLWFNQTTQSFDQFQCLCLRPSGLSTVSGDCARCARVSNIRIQVGDEYVEHKTF